MSDKTPINIVEELHRLSQETLIYGFSGIAVRVTGIVLVPFYTKAFIPSDYGILELSNTFIQIMITLTILGLDYSSGYFFYQTEDIERRRQIMGTALAIQLLLALVFFIIGISLLNLLQNALFGTHANGRLLAILTLLAIPLSVLFKFIQIMLRFLRKPKLFSTLSIGLAIITAFLGIFLVVIIKYRIVGAIIAVLLSNSLATIIGIIWIRHWIRFGIAKELIKPLLKLGLPLVPAGIAWWVLNFSNRFFLKGFENLSSVGILAVSNKVAMLPGFIVNAVQMSWGPFVLSLRDRSNANYLYAFAFTGITAATCFATVAISLIAPEIIRVGTSPGYYKSAEFVPYLGIAVIATGLYNLWSTGATLAGKSRILMEAVLIGAIANIILNMILIKPLGILGTVLANAICCSIMAASVLIKSQKCWHIPYEKVPIMLILIGAIFAMIVGNIFPHLLILRIFLFFGYSILLIIVLKPSRIYRVLVPKKILS